MSSSVPLICYHGNEVNRKFTSVIFDFAVYTEEILKYRAWIIFPLTDESLIDPQLLTMMATDSIRREPNGQLSRDGIPLNTTTTTLYMMQKLINIPIDLIDDAKFGMLDQPLTDYTSDFRFAEIDCSTYRNGVPTRAVTETLECGAYLNGTRTTAPFVNIDCGVYITN